MKVKILETRNKFKPITLEVVIETEQELCDWWLRLNVAGKIVDEAQDVNYFNYKALVGVSDEVLVKELTQLCKQKELFLNGIHV